MSKQKRPQKKTPAWEQAQEKISRGPLFQLAWHVRICRDPKHPLGKTAWAYVTGDGAIQLNPQREASAGEWEYIISHCLLHLGFGHIREERDGDLLWNAACDLVVGKFLRDSHIGTPPPEFRQEPPCVIKSEEQVYDWLSRQPKELWAEGFGTMAGGRTDMVWVGKTKTDYTEILAESLQASLRNTLRETKGFPVQRGFHPCRSRCMEAREWFISSYPLLGALAASFRIVDDEAAVSRMNIPVAAVSAQMQEIYINPRCRLEYDEWKFVLAHEFLHAALRHDMRCEDRDPELWNVACDYVVNDWLQEMGVGVMPEFGLFDGQFHGMSVEAVYDSIYEDIRRYRRENAGDVLYGDGTWWDTLEGGKTDAFYRAALQQGLACHQRKGRGLLPAGLVEEIYAVSRPPIRWDVELDKWFDEQFIPVEKHRTYSRLSRRQNSAPDIPRPAWRMEEQLPDQRIFGVLLDTSGSMDRSLLAAALGSIASYSEARDVHHIRVVFCDAAVYDQGVMSPKEIAGAVKVRGRGGTRLQPGIDLLDEDSKFPKDAPLLIITDGACDRLNLRGRNHAFLIPSGSRLPFIPKGPVFPLK